jgi:hypothetical protein
VKRIQGPVPRPPRRTGEEGIQGPFRSSSCRPKEVLKVLTNEKRGGLKVVAFDTYPFKLFTLRFSNKSVQASHRIGPAPICLKISARTA